MRTLALNKLEKVALRMRKNRNGKPLVLCISNIHMFDDNEESMRLLLQFQQRAESWAASGELDICYRLVMGFLRSLNYNVL